jgi:hypothetical protein
MPRRLQDEGIKHGRVKVTNQQDFAHACDEGESLDMMLDHRIARERKEGRGKCEGEWALGPSLAVALVEIKVICGNVGGRLNKKKSET